MKDVIKSLDDYVYMLGVSSVQLKDLAEIQHNAIGAGYLQPDELDQARAVKYCMVQAFAAIRVLLEMINEHTTIDIEKTQKRLQSRLKDATSSVKRKPRVKRVDTDLSSKQDVTVSQ